MVAPPRQTLRDYCRRIDFIHICLGFQPTNPITFDIKTFARTNSKENLFDGQEIRYHWEHLAKFYETCLMCKPSGDINEDRVKLHLFGFSFIGRAKYWLQCISNGTIHTWKQIEDKFLERYYSNVVFVERKVAITTFTQEEA